MLTGDREMEFELTSVHFIYLGFIAAILAFMLLRLDTTFISLAGVFSFH